MANALKCDRCGCFYEKNEKIKSKGIVFGGTITGIVTISGTSDKDEWFDLCDKCIMSFEDFMAGKEVKGIER